MNTIKNMQMKEQEKKIGNSRPLKFRAWNELENKFITLDDYEMLIRQDGMVVSFGVDNDGDGYFNYYEKSHPHIKLMQFTGLNDKNGNPIYEGDIVKYKYESSEDTRIDVLSCIEFSDGSFHPLPYDDTDGSEYYTYKTYDFEVIGNIYENPELLNQGE